MRLWVWRWGATLRVGKTVFKLRSPSDEPLFSERYGYSKTLLRFRGYRLLTNKVA